MNIEKIVPKTCQCSFQSFNQHGLFQTINSTCRTCQFKSIMCGNNDGGSIRNFWKHIKTLHGFKHHWLLHSFTNEELEKVIPFCVHGDGAEMYRDDEHFIVSWSSGFMAGGSYRDCLTSRFPISIVAERNMTDDADLCLQTSVLPF